jgi:hypothetical protein
VCALNARSEQARWQIIRRSSQRPTRLHLTDYQTPALSANGAIRLAIGLVFDESENGGINQVQARILGQMSGGPSMYEMEGPRPA